MNTKNLLVSFVVIAMALFLVSTVSALTIDDVTINGVNALDNPALIAGEDITVKVYFTADEDLSEVVVKAELGDNEVETNEFNIVEGNSYKKVLTLKVPYDFDDDELFADEDFVVTIEGEDEDGETVEATPLEVTLTIQRPDYNVEIKPIHVPSKVEAGEKFSVDVIVENNGYNDLDDLYITAKCSELDIEETFYIGDLVDSKEADEFEDDESSVHKRIELKVPYDAEAGEYTLEVSVSNEDANIVKAVVVVTENNLPNQVIKTDTGLIIINPTDKVAVYTVVVQSPASVNPMTVVVESGSSEKVAVNTNTEGEYSFDVNVFSATGKLISTVNFSGSASNEEEVIQFESPVVVLTIVLAIIFLVLLVVLIVLITKKPEKAEEFGESYY